MIKSLDYWLTTPRLRMQQNRSFSFAEATLRILDDARANEMRTAMAKRLISMAQGNDTYAPKIEAFRGVTSLVLRATAPNLDASGIREIGQRYEQLLFLTEAFASKRGQIHRLLGVNAAEYHPSTDLVLPVTEKRWSYKDRFSTRTVRRPTAIQGLGVSSRTGARFKALGLADLAPVLVRPPRCQTIQRVQEALRWLDQSLLENDGSAAVVKTCIGLESLFGFDKNEPLRQCISDRGAFLVARTPDDRRIVSKLLRDYYDLRSAIVHGSRRSSRWTDGSQQQLDRLLFVSAVSLASLASQYPKVEGLRAFFDGLKWSTTGSIPPSPVSDQLLARTYRQGTES